MRLFVLGLTAFAGTAAFAAGWPMYGHDVRQSRFNAGEIVIGPQNVGSLHQAWFLPTGSRHRDPDRGRGRGLRRLLGPHLLGSGPVIADGMVFVGVGVRVAPATPETEGIFAFRP